MPGLSDEYAAANLHERMVSERIEEKIVERAALIVRMLQGNNVTARKQAAAAVERACRAEVVLAQIRKLPSHADLMTNPMARAMYELARREERDELRP